MAIEIIKKVELLVSLKGTENGKQQLWLVGTVFDKSVKPFPTSIIEEIKADRIPPTFKVLECEIIPEKEDEVEMIIEVIDDTPVEEPEALKGGSSETKPRVIRRAIPK